MTITKTDFLEWRQSAVTQELFKEIMQLIEDGRTYLEYNAGKDVGETSRIVGKLEGLRALLNISFEDNE